VSIESGKRIEIKGAQDLKLIPKLVQLEVERQLNLIEISKSLGSTINIKKEIIDVSDLLEGCGSKIIKACFKKDGVVYALRLPGFSGLLGREISPNKRLGTEFSERAKVKAGVGGIFHSDELPAYGITEEEKKAIALELGCSKDDGFAIVADQKPKAEKALQAVAERAAMCAEGVPREVRKANQDGTTSFLRPMPGAARLYPETDVVPTRPDTRDLKIPELITQKAEKFREKLNLGKDLADKMARSGRRELIEDLISKFSNIKPAFIAETILSTTKEIKRKFDTDVDSITDEQYKEIFGYLDKGKISKDVLMDVLIDYAKGKFRLEKYKMLSDQELEKEVRRILDENKDLEFKKVMGVVMRKLKGKASGKKIAEIVRKLT
ncbi:Glu-tRNA(Gln) amidotransferase subunit GatE, partial [Candidatus Woesearchaeota archaeon]|nr:Glu-tRNA(Gln) amidotransferase subunit GatE [Candidatus Woesearchaeota archaeon]